MQSILNFLVKHNHWFLFIILEGISFVLLFSFNSYHGATMFTSANSVAGNIYSFVSDIGGYFNLKDENEILLEHNKELICQANAMREELRQYKDSALLANSSYTMQPSKEGFYFNTAKVINNSINKVNNFVTINKGKNDNIGQDMGVFNEKGVIGTVYQTSDNFALVMPLLNSKMQLSCRIKDDNNFCSLKWNGDDIRHAYINDLPRHGEFKKGDVVVTSGFSSTFPTGIPVGEIVEFTESSTSNFNSAKVRLFVDFSTIDNVFVVGNDGKEEQKALEESITEEQ